MMFKTRITEMLGIEYPIIQGGMMWLADARLAAAVSHAGGLGIIAALSCENGEGLRREIRQCRELTDKPFGVNISMLPDVVPGESIEEYLDVIVAEQVTAIETAGRTPEPYLSRLKGAGIKVIHKRAVAQTRMRPQIELLLIVAFNNFNGLEKHRFRYSATKPQKGDLSNSP
jgi:NAD(P)H-dependent flavin oxidoreductase YrpB (nitropropane dioxygenase family)